MPRSVWFVLPTVTLAVVGLVGSSAVVASADPAPPAKSVPAARPAGPAAPSSKVPAAPAKAPLSSYQQVMSSTVVDPAGSQVAGSITCPTGTRVVGGGAVVDSFGLSENLNGSLPTSDGRGWRVYVNNASTQDGTFQVYAVCAQQNRAYRIVTGTGVDNPAGTQVSAVATCPSGTSPLGGGGLGSSTSTLVNLNSSIPTSTGWRVDVNNASTGGDTATAYVVCGATPNGYRQVSGTPVSVAPNTQSSGTQASCPRGLTVVSGGALSSSTATSVNLNSSAPSTQSSWVGYLDNASGAASTFTTYAVCAKAAAA